MNSLFTALLSVALFINTTNIFANTEIPNEFYITEQGTKWNKRFEIDTKAGNIGVVYRNPFGVSLVDYDLFDSSNQKIASARSQFIYYDAHFDIYDNEEQLIGMIEEYNRDFHAKFDIYARDSITNQAFVNLSFWGTTFTLYDPITHQEMANLHRPFFSWESIWTFNVTDKVLFAEKEIDSRVLTLIMAIQGDRNYWGRISGDRGRRRLMISPSELNAVLEKITAVSEKEGVYGDNIPSPETMEMVANELDNGYKTTLSANNLPIAHESIQAFIDYCLDVVQQDTTSEAKKNTIIYLLKMRLKS